MGGFIMEHCMEIKDVRIVFGHSVVLNDISCKLENGTYGLLGPNGAGKTTLMRCMTGLYSFKGEISLDGKNINKGNSLSHIGYLQQKFGLFPELSVTDMMKYMCNVKKIEKKKWEEEIKRCLEAVNMLEEQNKKIKHLSGGMVRRVGIAQALLGNPSIILLDEPTVGLDPEERMRFKEIINNLEKDKIIIVSTHIVEDVEVCCDHIIVIKQGKIVKVGSIDEIRNGAQNRVVEIEKEHLDDDNILFVEKSYLRDTKKCYRAITTSNTDSSVTPTVEDGYLCLLKEN